MKLYIVGSVGSGKTTLARRLSEATDAACWHLDEVVHEPVSGEPWGNRKRPVAERDARFAAVLGRESYIMEDVGREYFLEGMRRADTIVLLEPPLWVRKKRIVIRWIKQNLGLEKCIYRPRTDVLKSLLRWAENYDSGADGVKARIAPFAAKTIVLHNNRELRDYLKSAAGPGKPRRN